MTTKTKRKPTRKPTKRKKTYRVFYTVRTLQLAYVDVHATSRGAASDQADEVTKGNNDKVLTLLPETYDSEFEPNGEIEEAP